MFSSWLLGAGGGGQICSTGWFLWCKYSPNHQFQTTNPTSVNEGVRKRWENQLSKREFQDTTGGRATRIFLVLATAFYSTSYFWRSYYLLEKITALIVLTSAWGQSRMWSHLYNDVCNYFWSTKLRSKLHSRRDAVLEGLLAGWPLAASGNVDFGSVPTTLIDKSSSLCQNNLCKQYGLL